MKKLDNRGRYYHQLGYLTPLGDKLIIRLLSFS